MVASARDCGYVSRCSHRSIPPPPVRTHQEPILPRDMPAPAVNDPALADLLVACGRGDRVAFRHLYDLQSPRLYAIALRLTRQAALASDAVQEAFINVWRNAHRFDPQRGPAEAWLLGLVRFRAIDLLRRTAREVSGEELPEPIDETPDVLARLGAEQDATRLRACLEALPEDRRRLIVMSFMDGLSHTDLAVRTGAPLGSIKAWIRRGLTSLRGCLDGAAG